MEYVKAATEVSMELDAYVRKTRTNRSLITPCRVSGAWWTEWVGGVWITKFAGTHQRVPFHSAGRTAGRSLRAMRRALERAKIPAKV